jgi:hypothetical protein
VGDEDSFRKIPMKRFWIIALVVAVLAGIAVAIVMGTAAWDHNSQGEYRDLETGAVYWGTFGPLIVESFAIPFLIVLLAATFIRAVTKIVGRTT